MRGVASIPSDPALSRDIIDILPDKSPDPPITTKNMHVESSKHPRRLSTGPRFEQQGEQGYLIMRLTVEPLTLES
jgi:hypothetical protein